MGRALLLLGAIGVVGCSCGGDDAAGDDDAGLEDAGGDDAGADAGPSCPPDLHVEDPGFDPPACPDGPADGEADRLAEALEIVGLTRETFGWSEEDWNRADYLPRLFDDFVLSEFRPNHDDPVRSACHAAEITSEIDHALAGTHVLSRLVARAAAHLDRPVDETEPAYDIECEGLPLLGPLRELLGALGGSQTAEETAEAASSIPLDLQVALAPVVLALAEAAATRASAYELVGEAVAAQLGGALPGILFFNATRFDFVDARGDESAAVLELKRDWRTDLYQAAYHLAVTLDHARPALEALAGARGFAVDFATPGGRVLINDGADHTYDWGAKGDREAIALLVDAGGDDTYRVPVGGVIRLEQPVALGLDLGGNDFYGYVEVEDPDAGVGHRIPMDAYGRYGIPGDYGPFSLSEVSRQGAARFGVAVHEDLGGGMDEYRSLRMSQGFAAVGVGILHDDGGDDTYIAEAGAQGSAMFGIGLHVDEGGSDEYTAYHLAQGFGYTRGAGWLVDAGGDDAYVCDHGIPDEGGDPLYYSPQRPGNGNSSFCQGGGFGLRGDTLVPGGIFWSGGLGVLRDREGDDSYEASVFAQGTGYWSGIGLLSDGGGNDRYEAIWYVQAGSAHYATAILVDSGDGNDVFNDNEWIVGVGVGSGHDYSLGLFINEGGNDRYYASSNGAGTGNCNGIGLFVDNGGDDTYRAQGTWNFGHAHVSGECDRRSAAITDAVFLDVGGADTYDRAGETLVLEDDVSWTQSGADYPSEHGVGLDAPDGDSTLHAP